MASETEAYEEIYLQDDMDSEMEQYKSIFVLESREHLQAMTESLITLENNPEDADALNKIFRSAHTIKGSSAMMGFQKITELTHTMEDAFDQLRKGARMPEGLMDIIFECMDILEARIGNLENDVEEELDFDKYIGILRGINFSEDEEPFESSEDGASWMGEIEFLSGFSESATRDISETVRTLKEDERCLAIEITLSDDCLFKAVRAFMAVNNLKMVGRIVDTAPNVKEFERGSFDSKDFLVILVTEKADEEVRECVLGVSEVEGVSVTLIDDSHLENLKSEKRSVKIEKGRKDTEMKVQSINSIRVQTDQLDTLMNLVGELVINKIQLTQIGGEYKLDPLKHSIDNIDRLTTELQDVVMRIRMVPVGQIFNRFPRLVRDLSRKEKKRVKLILEGRDIELDRTVLEEIGEPIIHLLRNAVDHGIEPLEVRAANGKPQEGAIRLVAERRQDHVLILVEDDGAGLDADKIKAKAISKGLVTEAEAKLMTQDQLVSLIMLPGFSTADEVTDVSGRGVGMDIVKTKIEALGGSVHLETQRGTGTKINLKLPLTLSIIKAMLVEVANKVFAIPISFVEETIQVAKSMCENLGAYKALTLRGGIIPIVSLNRLLNLPQTKAENYKIMVINREPNKFGLVVDSILGMQEIVTKNLNDSLRGIQGVSGVTILGDGRIIFILDPVNLYLSGKG